MQVISKALRKLLIVIALVAIVWSIFANWSYVFSKTVRGELMEVERVMQPTAVLGSNVTAEQMFSFAVLIRAESGEIYSSSSEDRQWAIAKKGMCIEAQFYPYPPWNLEKADTFFNARLKRVLADCKRVGPPAAGPPSAGAATATPAPAPSPSATP